MASGFAAGVFALIVAVQMVETRACSPSSKPTPANPAPTQPVGVRVTTSDGVSLTAETVVTGLEIPWSMAFSPDGLLFVTERPGRVRIIDLTTRASELALTLDDVFTQAEAGLLGLALDPEFAQNRLVYLYYSATLRTGGRVNRVVRYREAASRLGERVVLLDNIPAAQIHDGGRLRFGPDGLLYVSSRFEGSVYRVADDGSVEQFATQEAVLRARLEHARRQRAQNAARQHVLHAYGLLQTLEGLLQEFRTDLIHHFLPALEREASELVSIATDGRYRRLFLDREFTVRMEDRGRSYVLRRFSGGEQDVACLALRLALARLACRSRSRHFVVLDEIFGSQDRSCRRSLLDALDGNV